MPGIADTSRGLGASFPCKEEAALSSVALCRSPRLYTRWIIREVRPPLKPNGFSSFSNSLRLDPCPWVALSDFGMAT